MSIVDKEPGLAVAQVSDEVQAEATKRARWAAGPSDWLSLALDQHDAIRKTFDDCRAASGGPSRVAAIKRLALVLNGHALAEELVLYPALAQAGENLAAIRAYVEQTTAKLRMAELERLDPSSGLWLEKLEHIRAVVMAHMHEEEKGWFLDLKDKALDQTYLAKRFQEEFERYAGRGDEGPSKAPTQPKAPAEPRSFAEPRTTIGAPH